MIATASIGLFFVQFFSLVHLVSLTTCVTVFGTKTRATSEHRGIFSTAGLHPRLEICNPFRVLLGDNLGLHEVN